MAKPIPENVLVDRVRRRLEREGAKLCAYRPNQRFHNLPGDWYIVQPTREAGSSGGLYLPGFAPPIPTFPTQITGTLEEYARELGVLEPDEYHALV